MVLAMFGLLNLSAAATHEVAIASFTFTPDSLSILVGDTVHWVLNNGIHSTTSGTNGVPDGKWDSDLMSSPGDTFNHVFSQPGPNPYFCTLHWSMGMVGVIVVTGAGMAEEAGQKNFVPASIAPNPMKRTATITFSLTAASRVKLGFYDVSGKRIRTLVDGFRPAGAGWAVWSGDDDSGKQVGSGIYFCSFEAGSVRRTLKLTVVRL
jgi:plastocyanin